MILPGHRCKLESKLFASELRGDTLLLQVLKDEDILAKANDKPDRLAIGGSNGFQVIHITRASSTAHVSS